MSPGINTARLLFRRNALDEMIVGRTEKRVTGHVAEKPILTRTKPRMGSYAETRRIQNGKKVGRKKYAALRQPPLGKNEPMLTKPAVEVVQ